MSQFESVSTPLDDEMDEKESKSSHEENTGDAVDKQELKELIAKYYV